jgi:hypothetical protein
MRELPDQRDSAWYSPNSALAMALAKSLVFFLDEAEKCK